MTSEQFDKWCDYFYEQGRTMQPLPGDIEAASERENSIFRQNYHYGFKTAAQALP